MPGRKRLRPRVLVRVGRLCPRRLQRRRAKLLHPFCDLSAPDCPEGSHCLEYFGGFGLETPVCLEQVGYCIADDALIDSNEQLR